MNARKLFEDEIEGSEEFTYPLYRHAYIKMGVKYRGAISLISGEEYRAEASFKVVVERVTVECEGETEEVDASEFSRDLNIVITIYGVGDTMTEALAKLLYHFILVYHEVAYRNLEKHPMTLAVESDVERVLRMLHKTLFRIYGRYIAKQIMKLYGEYDGLQYYVKQELKTIISLHRKELRILQIGSKAIDKALQALYVVTRIC